MSQLIPEEKIESAFKSTVVSELQIIKQELKGMEAQFSALENELKFLVDKLNSLSRTTQDDSLSFRKY